MNCPQDYRLPSAIVMRAMLICAYIMNSNGVDVSLRLSLSLSSLAVDRCVGCVCMYVHWSDGIPINHDSDYGGDSLSCLS